MFTHYFVIAWRNLLKNKVRSVISILGLAIGLSATTVVIVVNFSELSWDSFWPEVETLFLVETHGLDTGNNRTSNTPHQLKDAIKDTIPKVAAVARLDRSIILVSLLRNAPEKQDSFQQSVTHIDPELLHIFQFKQKSGSIADFHQDINSAIISESIATKFFGDENPIGHIVVINESQLRGPAKAPTTERVADKQFKVVAVIEDIKSRSSEVFQLLIPYQESRIARFKDWDNLSTRTYIKLNSSSDTLSVEQQLNRLADSNINSRRAISAAKRLEFKLLKVADRHLQGAEASGSLERVWMLYLLGAVTLLITVVNYINLGIAGYLQRQKEVALRKTLGATRQQLFRQFWLEGAIHCCLAFLLTLMVIEPLLPWLASTLELRLETQLFHLNKLTLSLLALVTGLSLIVGGYPGLYLAKTRPAYILGATPFSESPKNILLRKSLVLFQFIASACLLIAVGLVALQLYKAETYNPGYETKNIALLHNPRLLSANAGQFSSLKKMLLELPEINALSRVRPGVPGEGAAIEMISLAGQSEQQAIPVSLLLFPDYAMFEVFKIPLAAGRLPESGDTFFKSRQNKSNGNPTQENAKAVICHQTLAKFGFASAEAAIGQSLKIYFSKSDIPIPIEIVGVTDKVHIGNHALPAQACVFWQVNFGNALPWAIRYQTRDRSELFERIDAIWVKVLGSAPYHWLLEDSIAATFKNERILANFLYVFAAMAVLISALGLSGLAALASQKRTREIALRKLHGASAGQIVRLLLTHFSLMVLLANIIAWPISLATMNLWLNKFSVRIDLWFWGPTFCVLTMIFLLAMTWLIAGGHALTVAREKPIHVLRGE